MGGAPRQRARDRAVNVALLAGGTAALLLLARALQWLSELQIGYLTR